VGRLMVNNATVLRAPGLKPAGTLVAVKEGGKIGTLHLSHVHVEGLETLVANEERIARTWSHQVENDARAEAFATKYELPGSVTLAKEQLTVRATITKVSHAPSLTEIAPYKDAITYVRMSVDGVVTGTYTTREILVLDYVIKNDKYTPVAEWKPGQKKLLELERLDMHSEVEDVYSSQDENDPELVPYLAVKVSDQP